MQKNTKTTSKNALFGTVKAENIIRDLFFCNFLYFPYFLKQKELF